MKHCKVKKHAWVIEKASPHFFRRNFLDLSLRLTPSFEVDPLLKRTFLHAIPVWELDKVVGSKKFNICDVCVALVTFCSCNAVPAGKVSDLLLGITFELIRHYIVAQNSLCPGDFLWITTVPPLNGSILLKTFKLHSLNNIADPSSILDACHVWI